jgi:hypothetical protein
MLCTLLILYFYTKIANLCYQYLSPLMLWVRIPLREGVLDITLCDTVCQWLTAGRWFSLDTPVSSTNKTYCHDITKILLKVALNTITLTLRLSDFDMCCSGKCLGKISRRRYWGNVVEKESFMASLRKWKHDPLHTYILIMPLPITYLNHNILVRSREDLEYDLLGVNGLCEK